MLATKTEIGRMDERITFQQEIIGANVSNEDVQTGWQDIGSMPTVWANVEPIAGSRPGNEEYRADKLTAFETLVFEIRYRSDLTTELRISYNGKYYDIVAITEVGRKNRLRITAELGPEYQEIVT